MQELILNPAYQASAESKDLVTPDNLLVARKQYQKLCAIKRELEIKFSALETTTCKNQLILDSKQGIQSTLQKKIQKVSDLRTLFQVNIKERILKVQEKLSSFQGRYPELALGKVPPGPQAGSDSESSIRDPASREKSRVLSEEFVEQLKILQQIFQ